MTIFPGGRRSGLKLVINVEQYEYMKGPQDDSGVKVFNFNASSVVVFPLKFDICVIQNNFFFFII